MGLLAFPAMLKAGYSIRLSAGVVTAGGTLGILIPPSVLLILYGATAGVSVVQLYAGAFLPGFMLTGLYLGYIIISAKLKPSIAPPLSAEDQRVELPKFAEVISKKSNNVMVGLIGAIKGKRNADVPMKTLLNHLIIAILPALAAAFIVLVIWLWTTAPSLVDTAGVQEMGFAAEESGAARRPLRPMPAGLPGAGGIDRPGGTPGRTRSGGAGCPGRTGRPRSRLPRSRRPHRRQPAAPGRNPAPLVFWITFGIVAVGTVIFYAIFTFARLEIFKMLLGSFFPLALIILGVLGTIVVGLATPTEAAAMGSFGGFVLAAAYKQLNFTVVKESVFLTAKTSAMVCWLFIGSSIFAAAFALLGGQEIINDLGEVDEHDADPVHAPGAGDHLPAGLAAGVDRDHRHLHADLHPAPGALQHRSALLRSARGPEPPDGVPLAAGGDGRLLPEGGGAAARDAEPDLHRDDAVHGDPVFGDLFALHVPADRSVGAVPGVQRMTEASASAPGFRSGVY